MSKFEVMTLKEEESLFITMPNGLSVEVKLKKILDKKIRIGIKAHEKVDIARGELKSPKKRVLH